MLQQKFSSAAWHKRKRNQPPSSLRHFLVPIATACMFAVW